MLFPDLIKQSLKKNKSYPKKVSVNAVEQPQSWVKVGMLAL